MDVWVELIRTLPALVNSLVIVFLVVAFYRPLRELLPSLQRFSGFGVEMQFVRRALDEAIDQASKSGRVASPPAAGDVRSAERRARRNRDRFRGARILWIDDSPGNNASEMRMLRALGCELDHAPGTEEALALLRTTAYDLVISDIQRSSGHDGLQAIPELKSYQPSTPIIFYVGHLEDLGVPAGAFGITNRPDELLHLLADAFARRRS